jgi:hypothetical protein
MWWRAWKARRIAAKNYRNLLAATAQGKTDLVRARKRLDELAHEAKLSAQTQLLLLTDTANGVLDRLLADSLPEARESEIVSILDSIGVNNDFLRDHATAFADFVVRIAVARANAGRLEILRDHGIVLKDDEVAHLQVRASLMKEVRRTTRTYGGFSFRLAKGIYYHVGSSSVGSVSTSLEEADSGTLTVTSRRVIYTGQRQSREMLHSKIMAVNTYDDGIEFNLSNRQNAPLFRLQKGFGHMLAATLNAAMHHKPMPVPTTR